MQILFIVNRLWLDSGSSPAQTAALIVALLLLLLLLPLGWLLLRRFAGAAIAGPLWPLLLVELLALAYAFASPPWETPDEPRHMEYVELLRLGRPVLAAGRTAAPLPQAAAGDQEIARTIVSSLMTVEHFERRHVALSLEPPIVIPGPSELVHPPLYYQIAALITLPFGAAPILARLALVRVLGALLAGWTAWACGAVGRLLWPDRPLLALAPMLLLAGVPTFLLFSGAANNDSLANLLSALLVLVLLVGVVGRTWLARPLPWLAAIGLLLVASALTKRTTLPLWPLVPLAVLLRLPHRRRALLAVAGVLLLLAAATLALLPRERLALWLTPATGQPYRCPGGFVGEWSICAAADQPQGITQLLPLNRVYILQATPMTLGFWARASSEGQQWVVSLDGGAGAPFAEHTITPGTDWQFQRLSLPPPPYLARLRLQFRPQPAAEGMFYLDGVFLTPWGFSDQPPKLADQQATAATWDGRTVYNELLNGSGEEASLLVPEALPLRARQLLAVAFDRFEVLLQHPGLIRDSLPILGDRLVQTFAMFWATVGWPLPPVLFPDWLLWGLGLLSVLGLVGLGLALIKPRLGLRRDLLLFLCVAWALVLVAAVVRDLPPRTPIVISGRYLYPGLAASLPLLIAGWRRLWPSGDRSFVMVLFGFVLLIHALFVGLLWWPYFMEGIG